MSTPAAALVDFATAQRGGKKPKVPAGQFVSADLSSSDLHGLTISGKVGNPLPFEEALFNDANLADATISNVGLECASFKGANLTRVKFINCRLVGADVTDATLANTVFENCKLGRAKFPQSIHATFKNCRMVDVDFAGRDLRISTFIKCALWGTDFSNSNLRSTNFEGCDAGSKKLGTPNFTGADLRAASMTMMNPLPLGMDALTLGGVSYALVRSASGDVYLWSETTESWNTLEMIAPTLSGSVATILTLMASV
jgi:uncharacterized protein YjbI with pentapeptide repeats